MKYRKTSGHVPSGDHPLRDFAECDVVRSCAARYLEAEPKILAVAVHEVLEKNSMFLLGMDKRFKIEQQFVQARVRAGRRR